MFGLFASVEKKMRANAQNWLELAAKVYHYRRDLLAPAQLGELRQKTEALRQQLQARADASKLKLAIESLEGVLRQTGGRIYPKSSLVENVEFFLVAAIVILGIRTYFVQPFKIPTNSMWPSYYGMTGELYSEGEPAPGALAKSARFALLGARHFDIRAPRDGELSRAVRGGQLGYTTVRGRTWLVFPTTLREYTFYVGGEPVSFRVPMDFNEVEKLLAASIKARGSTHFKAGEPILRFDLLTGDQLFVDRFSYHFMRPQVGQGFVFRTGNIPAVVREYGDQYYIKRLVGVPGDKLEVREPELYRNGEPIRGAEAFGKNARREGLYAGYRYQDLLDRGKVLEVPADAYFAMGDNSQASFDGRSWGFVPEKDVVGRPLFIYYPFTRRWGLAR